MASVFAFFLLLVLSSFLEVESGTGHHSCTQNLQEHRHHLNDSAIHLTVHHLHGPCSPVNSSKLPVFSTLERDRARVRMLNHRLTKNDEKTKSSPGPSKLRPKTVGIPLNPGASIGIGNYVIKLGMGTPSRDYVMVFDTGSSFTWLQCQPCTVYCHGQTGPIFDPKASSTYKSLSCNSLECTSLSDATLNPPACESSGRCIYQASYGDGSYSVGYLSRDALTLASSQTVPGFVYGCGGDNNGLFGQSAGLVGLARNKLSLLAQLSSKYGYAFSYCLPTSTSTGTLSIGHVSIDPSLYAFTRMYSDSRDPSLYFLHITSISVAGKSLPVSTSTYKRTPTIIDSGTVITRLPPDIYSALRTAFVKAMSRYTQAPSYSILDTCFRGRTSGMSVPEVRLVFEGGSDMKLEARNVLYEVSDAVTCLAFASNEAADGLAIIGNHQQLTFGVVFDVSNSRVGFAAGGCS